MPPVSESRLHHLNCGTMCPWGQRYINGEGGLLASARLVCHVLLIEGADGLALVDTGFGSDDVRNPRQISVPFTAMMRPRLEVGETAVSQVRARGFDPADVRRSRSARVRVAEVSSSRRARLGHTGVALRPTSSSPI